MNKDKIRKIAIIVSVFVVLTVIGYFLSSRKTDTEIYVLSSGSPPEERKIVVSLNGEIKNPGKYSVPYASSVHDILFYANGVTDNADLSAIRLDERIFENSDIFVPAKVYVRASELSENSDTGLCNINTADINELMELNGIGETLARNIINYREVNGSFKSIEDIMNVSGIGKGKYEAIKDKITVGGN